MNLCRAEIDQISNDCQLTYKVIPGVATLIKEVQVEGTFPDGTKLVSSVNKYVEREFSTKSPSK